VKEEKDGTYVDKLTLDEIAKNDDDMTREAIKNANRYHFKRYEAANAFTTNAFILCMRKIGGVIEKDKQSGHFFSPDRRTRVEQRDRYQGQDLWRNGIYIYRDDVLAYFIGKPQLFMGSASAIIRIPPQALAYWVVTNAPLNGGKIYSMPSVVGSERN